MPRHSEAHTRSRLNSTFETLVARAQDDIRAELKNPRFPRLAINGDRLARWEAASRMVLSGELILCREPKPVPTHRPGPDGKRRTRMEMMVRLPDMDDWVRRHEEVGA